MSAGLALGEYLVPHALARVAEMGADVALADARHVAEVIARRGWERFSQRELMMAVSRGRFPKVTDLDAPLALLVAHGYLRRQEAAPRKPGQVGRSPSPVFEVSPLWSR
jgi:hypothetical protein